MDASIGTSARCLRQGDLDMVRWLKIVLVGTLVAASFPPADAEIAALTEYEVKAAFLYNFAKFVEWPPDAFKSAGDSFVIGILGDDPFGSGLEQNFSGKMVQDKKLVFKRLANVDEAVKCPVVYISGSEEGNMD